MGHLKQPSILFLLDLTLLLYSHLLKQQEHCRQLQLYSLKILALGNYFEVLDFKILFINIELIPRVERKDTLEEASFRIKVRVHTRHAHLQILRN